MSFLHEYPCKFPESKILSQEIRLSLSKQRIIQKNLVHLQGFPDSLYNENLLLSNQYLGQYGFITKIVLALKENKITQKRVNSAYITFETNEQAAYCILTMDSIKIDEHRIRAFFGTTKYCNHFLNNFHCFNEEKCIFLHYIADPSDIIDENTKFGYKDHINLAKNIISFGSLQSRLYVSNNYCKDTILPNIKTIYDKEYDLFNNLNHLRNLSNLSNESTNNSSNNSNYRNLSEDSSKEKDKNDLNDSNENINNENILFINNCKNYDCFKSKKKSRFFNNINKDYKYDENYNSNIAYIVNNLCIRMSFFNYFKNNNQKQLLKEIEQKYCLNLYKKTNDNEIKSLIENIF